MKKLLLTVLACAAAATLQAEPMFQETPIRIIGAPEAVSISTFSWVKLPAAANIDARSGLYYSLPSGATSNMAAHFGNCTSTSISTTTQPMEIVKGTGWQFQPIAQQLCMWVVSKNTSSAETIYVQQISQRYP